MRPDSTRCRFQSRGVAVRVLVPDHGIIPEIVLALNRLIHGVH